MAMGVCVYLKPHQAAVPPGISSNKFRLNGARPEASRLLAPCACEGVVKPGGVRITSHIPVFMSLRTSAHYFRGNLHRLSVCFSSHLVGALILSARQRKELVLNFFRRKGVKICHIAKNITFCGRVETRPYRGTDSPRHQVCGLVAPPSQVRGARTHTASAHVPWNDTERYPKAERLRNHVRHGLGPGPARRAQPKLTRSPPAILRHRA